MRTPKYGGNGIYTVADLRLEYDYIPQETISHYVKSVGATKVGSVYEMDRLQFVQASKKCDSWKPRAKKMVYTSNIVIPKRRNITPTLWKIFVTLLVIVIILLVIVL